MDKYVEAIDVYICINGMWYKRFSDKQLKWKLNIKWHKLALWNPKTNLCQQLRIIFLFVWRGWKDRISKYFPPLGCSHGVAGLFQEFTLTDWLLVACGLGFLTASDGRYDTVLPESAGRSPSVSQLSRLCLHTGSNWASPVCEVQFLALQ